MSRIEWDWEDIDASQLEGDVNNGTLELPNGDVLRWHSVYGNRIYYVNNERIYDPTETDKLTVMAALAVEDILIELGDRDDE